MSEGSDQSVSPAPGTARGQVGQPTIVTESALPDGSSETQVSSPLHGRSISRYGPDGRIQTYEGRPAQGEGNVADALHRLRDHLNLALGEVVWRERAGHTDPKIDGTLDVHGRPEIQVLCQVTRVERDTLQRRGARSTAHRADSSHSEYELANNLVAAVKAKQSKADQAVVLVLDTNDAPAYTDDAETVERARGLLAGDGLLGEWRAIWLVGPTTGRTHCLDGDRLLES